MNPGRLYVGALVGLNPGSTHRRRPTRDEHDRLRALHGEGLADEMMRGPWTFEGWRGGLASCLRVGEPEATVLVHHNDLRTATVEGLAPWRRGPIATPVSTRACLLQALLVGPGYGGVLISRVKAVGLELEQGSVYPTLRTLAREGLIELAGAPQTPRRGGRPEITYRLTADGVVQARKDRGVLAALVALEEPR